MVCFILSVNLDRWLASARFCVAPAADHFFHTSHAMDDGIPVIPKQVQAVLHVDVGYTKYQINGI